MKRHAAVLGLVAVLAAAAAAYLPSIDGAFLFDDERGLLDDPVVRDPGRAGAAAWLATSRPVGRLTFAINHAAVGLDPRGWHLTNVAIHLATVVLSWLLARVSFARAGLARPGGPALAAAALFALHPIQTESVAYLSQRFESLASGVYVLALLILLARDSAPGRRRWTMLGAATALHAVALGVKPTAATLPAAWLLHAAILPAPGEEGLPAWRRAWRRFPAALPLLAMSALAAATGLRGASGSIHAGWAVPGLSPAEYIATQLRVIPTYLRLLAWPAGQCADWYFPASRGFLEPAVLGGAALLAGAVVGALVLAARAQGATGDGPAAARAASFGILFFLLALAPSSLIPLLDPLAEHRVYLAAMGAFLALSAGAAAALRRLVPARSGAAGAALAVAAAAALGIATERRNAIWATPLALWTDTAAKAPEKSRVHMNLGLALHGARRFTQALAEFRHAQELMGDHTISERDILQNLVSTLAILGRTDEARTEISRALAVSPRDSLALSLLANVEYVSSRMDAAESAAQQALASDSGNWIALKYLGMARLARGDVTGALQSLRAAAATGAEDPQLHWVLGGAEERSGDFARACEEYALASATTSMYPSAQAQEAAARLRCP